MAVCVAAFTAMLNDKSDLVQECAGKGLAMVYENSEGTMKSDLLHSLVRTESLDHNLIICIAYSTINMLRLDKVTGCKHKRLKSSLGELTVIAHSSE